VCGRSAIAAGRRAAAALAAAALVVPLAGCGVGPGKSPASAQLVITQDFGAHPLAQLTNPKVGGADTVMRFLERNAKVTTRYGGGYVQSIAGRSGGTRDGRPVDWFFYVNGILASKGAASTRLRDGAVIWWDRHDWTATQDVPAVVGSFPEPFIHGIAGRRLPTRLECIAPGSAGCEAVQKHLTDAGILAPEGGLQSSLAKETLRVLVGPYRALRADGAVRQLEHGPQASGVYARPSPDGGAIATLDADGRTVRRLRAGTGLVAATRFEGGQPVWIVTGTDEAGVAAAASALDEGNLKNRFAVAVSDGRAIPLPQDAP
jgi:uncharacterized protein DUF4430